MEAGILKSSTNTGAPSELLIRFAAPLSVYSNQPSYVQDMMNLKRRTNSQNVQRWEIEAHLEPSNSSSDFLVHSVANGHHQKFYVRMPQVYGALPSKINNNTVALTVNANSTIVKIIDESENTRILNGRDIVKGEFIRFANHTKVYLVTDRYDDEITVSPSLRTDVPSTTSIIRGGKVTLECFYDTNVSIGITYIDGILSDPGSIKLVEAV